MKNYLLTAIGSLIVLCSPGQLLKKNVLNSHTAFADSLNKIVNDYPNNFKNIQGVLLPQEIDADAYQSVAGLPGASNCIIKRYHSLVDNSASWQAVLYNGDNFEAARKAYKSIFTQVKKTNIKTTGNHIASFAGELQTVEENMRFAVSSLRLKATDEVFAQFAADIELVGNYDGWQVHLNIYRKKKDTEGGNLQ
jgi:hypothetical protein